MSGHSKWATIKRKKGAIDAARGRLFTRLIREVTMAARSGGDPAGNPRLRLAVTSAKANNMPADNIKRAIQRGTGELPGVSYEELMYEGYGPGGVALLIEVVTDNKNRSVSEVRHILGKNGGSMAETGAVSWNFSRRGVISVPREAASEDALLELALEAGADDMRTEADGYEIIVVPEHFETVRKAVEAKGITMTSASMTSIPNTTVKVEGKDAEVVLRLVEALEENDDVQAVHANFDIDDDVLASFNA
jgi:YebC/PmpR family DNA-binding regulatory protein